MFTEEVRGYEEESRPVPAECMVVFDCSAC
jgi:hypothetical protein